MKCPFCKAERKDKIFYECGTLDNDPYPRTYKCALEAYLRVSDILHKIYEAELEWTKTQ